MAYYFADSFDLYAQVSDMIITGTDKLIWPDILMAYVPGRFGGQAISFVNGTGNALVKD